MAGTLLHTRIAMVMALVLTAAFVIQGHASTQPGPTLHLSLDRERVYAGESITVKVTLHSNGVKVRNIGYPQLTMPEGKAISFGRPVEEAEESGSSYRFAGQLAVARVGTFTLGPSELQCEVLEPTQGSAAFFGNSAPRQVTIVSEQATVTVDPLPQAGRPEFFSGAVGIFTMTVNVKPEQITPGSPLTVVTTIQGSGPLNNAKCPQIAGPSLKIYPVAVRHQGAQLVCEQVLIPVTAGKLPPVNWSFFDPRQQKYRLISHGLPTVAAATPRQQPAANSTPVKTLPPSATTASSGKQFPLGWLLVVLCLFLIVFIAQRVWRRRVSATLHELSQAEPLDGAQFMSQLEQALATKNVEKFYTAMFEMFQEIIGTANGQKPASVAAASAWPETATAQDRLVLSDIFESCLRIRYGSEMPTMAGMQADYERLRRIVGTIRL